LINIADSISYILFKNKFFRLTTPLRSGKGNEKKYTLYEKEHENEPPHSSLGRQFLIKLESFGDKIGYPFSARESPSGLETV